MANYGDEDTLELLTNSIADDVTSDLLQLGLDAADAWVLSKSLTISITSVPMLVEKAATYYAYVFILKNLYDTNQEEDPMMDWYEKQAIDLLGAYIAQNADEDSTIHPYSSSLTPTNTFTQRNKRTTIDNTDYDNVDDTQWISEE